MPGFADFVLEENILVGSAGFEQNLIVTKDGPELLTTAPMLWW